MTTASTTRAATVEFDHVTKVYGASAAKAGTPGAVNDLSLHGAGRQDLRARRARRAAARRRQPQDGQPADRADVGPDPDRRGGRRDPRRDRAAAGHRLRDPAGRPVPAPDDRRERRDGAAAARLAEGAAAANAPRSCSRLVGLDPAGYRDRYPDASSRAASASASASRGRWPPTRRSCSWTSPSAPSTRSSGSGSRTSSCASRSELAKTILFVTHDIDEAIKMGDLVAVMQVGGHVAQFGAAGRDPGRTRPPTFVARFVGADRGLKRLSLTRVNDLELRTVRDGARSATTRPRHAHGRAPIRSATCCSSTTAAGRWAGSTSDRFPPSGPLAAELAEPTSPLLDRRTRSRTPCRCCSTRDVQAGVVVDRHGRCRGVITVDQIAATCATRPPVGGRGRGRRTTAELVGDGAAGDVLDVAGCDHLDELADRTCPAHRGSRRDRRRRRLRDLVRLAARRRAPARASTARSWPSPEILYTIPSLALFAALVPITGLSLLTAEIPLVMYTLADLRPQHRRGLRQRPGGRPGGRRRHGLHAGAAAAARRAAAGHAADRRRRCGSRRVSTIGLVTVTGDPRRQVRRPRLLHPRGLPAQLPDRDLLRRHPVDHAGGRRRPAARPRPAPDHAVGVAAAATPDGRGPA